MCRWQIFSSYAVLLFVVIFSSSCCSAVNETSFVNNTRSRLRILSVFGHPGKSHFDVFQPLLEELARRGHDVTVLSYFPRTENDKIKESLPTYKDISFLNSEAKVYLDIIDLNNIKHTLVRPLMELFLLKYMANIACRVNLNHPAVQEFLRSDKKFDLIVTESFNTDCFLGFVHRFKAPYIYISSHQIMPWANDALGNEENPSYIPTIFLGYTRPMNFFQRAANTLLLPVFKVIYEYWFRPMDQAIANEFFGPDLPDLKEIAKQAQAMLVNTHSSLHGSRPQLPNVVEIGGLHIPSKIKPLPKDIAKFLDSAHEGALYFSLGSMIKTATMPQEKLDAILEVLTSIPRKVIWKWEDDNLPRKMDNVMIRKWLPQFDVLSK